MLLLTPSQDAQQHSLQLQHVIRQKIQAQGSIPFYDFMLMALYEPGLGYYSAGAAKLGHGGDFVTAPELSPFFGYIVVSTFLPVIKKLSVHQWLELGAGTGKLAESILNYLYQQGIIPEYYFILEVSADLKERQQAYLKANIPKEMFGKIRWLDHLPDSFIGIVIANEVFDALAVHRFKVTQAGILEQHVAWDNGFMWQEVSADSSRLIQKVQPLIEQYHLEPGYISEINLQQEALVNALGAMLTEGVMAFVDYGYAAREYYAPDRYTGTLRCHYQHLAHDDPFWWPGLQDITAHVDFTSLALSVLQNDLKLLSYASQGSWLMHAGIAALAQQQAIEHKVDEAQQYQWQQALRRLVSPNEMGELFKILIAGTVHFENHVFPMPNEAMRLG